MRPRDTVLLLVSILLLVWYFAGLPLFRHFCRVDSALVVEKPGGVEQP